MYEYKPKTTWLYQPVLNALRISTLGVRRPNGSVNYKIVGSFGTPTI